MPSRFFRLEPRKLVLFPHLAHLYNVLCTLQCSDDGFLHSRVNAVLPDASAPSVLQVLLELSAGPHILIGEHRGTGRRILKILLDREVGEMYCSVEKQKF